MLKRNLLCVLFALVISSLIGCGFHLRGAADVSFKTIHIQGNRLLISKNLSKSLSNSGVKVLPSTEGADLILETVKEESEKRILSLSGRGVVNEYELYYRVRYRTKMAGAELWSQVQTVEARRDFSYTDANLLAKQSEEARLNENMQADVVSSLLRRLSALKK
jgi:LPS-assembly lipoprotein